MPSQPEYTNKWWYKWNPSPKFFGSHRCHRGPRPNHEDQQQNNLHSKHGLSCSHMKSSTQSARRSRIFSRDSHFSSQILYPHTCRTSSSSDPGEVQYLSDASLIWQTLVNWCVPAILPRSLQHPPHPACCQWWHEVVWRGRPRIVPVQTGGHPAAPMAPPRRGQGHRGGRHIAGCVGGKKSPSHDSDVLHGWGLGCQPLHSRIIS